MSLYSIFRIKVQKLQPQKYRWTRILTEMSYLHQWFQCLCFPWYSFGVGGQFLWIFSLFVSSAMCVCVCECVCVWYNIEWLDARDGGWLRIPANHKVSKTHRMVAWLGRGEAARYIAREMHHNSNSWHTSTAVRSIDCDDWHWHRCPSKWIVNSIFCHYFSVFQRIQLFEL